MVENAFPATGLPVEETLPRLLEALRNGTGAVLEAPPGAGKTTLVPLALLGEDWLGGGKILVLEPRRLAARMAAGRMAELLGEAVGQTVGYRVRMESKVGPATRIEVITEGILTRRLIDDPELAGIGAVIFDEFHERGIHADLGMALCLEAREALREDLRILAMSATLDGASVASVMGGAPVIASEGRAFPIETRHLDRPDPRGLDRAMAAAIRQALDEEAGSILAFLPGEGEIRRVQALLEEAGPANGILVAPLFGAMAPGRQDAAIQPPPTGMRKVVLATDIAETSLTIEGIRIVVDGGYRRKPRFDPQSGMTKLETRRISRAGADQRRGRAGRLEPGVCYRLWPEAETMALARFETPEIMEADLAPLALDLACWGVADPADLRWPDPPPPAQYDRARDLLAELDAVDGAGRITAHGKEMARLPMHPRLAHMLVKAKADGLGGLACDIAALLEERDILGVRGDCDLRSRLEMLRGEDQGKAGRGAVERIRRAAKDLRGRLNISGHAGGDAGELLALAYPDRVARRRGAEGRYLLRNGRGAVLPEGDRLAAEDWLAVADLGGAQADARIYLAAPLNAVRIEALFAEDIERADIVEWDDRQGKVAAARRTRLGAITLKEEPLKKPSADAVLEAMLAGIRRAGAGALPWTDAARQWQARVAFLHGLDYRGIDWPDVSDASLMAELEVWLAPFLTGVSSLDALRKVDLKQALAGLLTWEQGQVLDGGAPTHWTAPTGSRLPLDYGQPDGPVLSVRLQEILGEAETPTVAGGKAPVLLHLLSPAGRPVQVTRDLAGFWLGSYAQVKAEMKGRYPKHFWPDNPLEAAPTRRTKKSMDRKK
jgi:ATP-dependent helicase HrpB